MTLKNLCDEGIKNGDKPDAVVEFLRVGIHRICHDEKDERILDMFYYELLDGASILAGPRDYLYATAPE